MPDDFKAFYNELLHSSIRENMPEAILERFEVLSCLAFGDAKELYLAVDKQLGTKAILRVTKNESGEDALSEARVLKSLDHPAIAKALGEWSQDGRGFLAREYFDGITLGDHVRESGTLADKEILDIAIQISGVMAYLEKQIPPVTHRDIKPENIVLTPDGEIKLIDFGIARVFVENADSDTRIMGPKYYMAPEQYGGAQSDVRSDIYSLGMVMIYLAAGVPDKGKAKDAIANQELLSAVLKCVRFDPDARFQSARDLKNKLLFIRNGGAKRLLSLVTAGLLCLCCIAAGYVFSDRWGYAGGLVSGEKHGVELGYAAGYAEGSKEGAALGYDEAMTEIWDAKTRQYDRDAARYFAQMPEGNTGGNLINHGIAAGNDDAIFYCLDGNVVKMDPDGNAETVHCNHSASQLCLYEGHLYHINTNDGEIYKSPQGGGSCVKLKRESSANAVSMRISDGSIYYTSGTDNLGLYRTGLDGGATELLNDLRNLKYYQIAGNELFFCDRSVLDYALYKCNLDGSNLTLLDESRVNWVNLAGGSLFYSSFTMQAKIIVLGADGSEREVLLDATANYLNATPYGLFFSNGRHTQYLYRASLDGRSMTQLNQTSTSDINVVGSWVFYRDEGNALHRMRVDGSDDVRLSMPVNVPLNRGDGGESA